MKAHISLLAPLVLLTLVLPVGSRKISSVFSQHETQRSIQLSMVKDSVDDMYSGCRSKMSDKVKDTYFPIENTGLFKEVWAKAKKCTERNMKHKEKEDQDLTEDHFQAICVYTSGINNFYDLFNDAVKTNRSEYGNAFKYHSLHFWLTSAIQILNPPKNCLTSYRRSKTEFTGQVNQKIRFGTFASSSMSKTLTQFGSQTCFKIDTCNGAYLKKYPELRDQEEEVLIPPYEMFNITEVMKDKFKEGLADCKVVYVLKSSGVQSNLNCKAAKWHQ